ncbi:hypothetical protein [Paenibacillus ginsengarvi]|uniref:Uncharacterized protein n=1 Tax=Paenibacillus ginsengarvi TaxID=400777 RepID=A0A3B0AWN7_9BACL|nr:hypothetical protein [Paenibacillus ginsengarvi]RKN64589.1 hypothetical protein D7M11_33635 [Paenibacillus ginsengarvi]
MDSAIRLTKRDKAGNALQYGVVVQKDWMFVESVILSSGGSMLSPDGSRAVGYLDSDASVRAVQRFVDLFLVDRPLDQGFSTQLSSTAKMMRA